MRELTVEEIEKLANGAKVKRVAVENFLMTMGDNEQIARLNLDRDAAMYKWNTATRNAISKGIQLAKKVKQN